MRKVLIVVPGWIGDANAEPWIDSGLTARLAERGEVFKLAPESPSPTPEAAYLGLDPQTIDARPGPLLVAAIGAQPPPKSVHFWVSVLTTVGEQIRQPDFLPEPEESAAIARAMARLNTKRFTSLAGWNLDHAAVWEEGSLDLATTEPTWPEPADLRASLPEGDGEVILRQFIDDSVNILSELEFNRRRIDEGRQPLNVLWPWGQGFRPSLPNLSLRYGPAAVISGAIRMCGLAKLVGLRHPEPSAFGSGTAIRLQSIREACAANATTIVVLDSFDAFRKASKSEEASWLAARLMTEVVESLLEVKPLKLLLLSPGEYCLGLSYDAEAPIQARPIPFHERAFETRLDTRETARLVANLLASE